MRKFYGLSRSLGGAIGAIALVSVLSSAVLLTALHQLHTTTEARGHSNQVLRELDAFRTAMLDQQTGLRGYILSGDARVLGAYRAGEGALTEAIAQLRQLVAKNSMQADQLAGAERAAHAWQADVGEPIVHAAAGPAMRAEAAKIESGGEGQRRFEDFSARLSAIQTEEERALATQSKVVVGAERDAAIALWGGMLVTLLICGAIGIAIHRLIARPLVQLASVMRQLALRDLTVDVPSTRRQSEVGEMARAVEVFKNGLIELDRTSLLRATADTLPAMVGYIDANRRVGFLNGEFERWFDLRAEDVSEVYGRPLADVFATEKFPGADDQLQAAFAGQEARFEHPLARRGSAPRDIEAFYRPHRGPNGRVLGVVTLLTDISERKRMENLLAQQTTDLLRSNEELEQFAYVASHDLKAPLRGIENLVTWIEEDIGDALSGDTRTNMDLLKSRVRRLEALLDDLLAYSRAGRGDIKPDLLNMNDLVEEISALVSPPEGFSIIAAPGLPTLDAARAPLTQVLQNLIGNAVKHHDHPASGHIWIDAHRLGSVFEFTVTDDGPGIPAQFRDRVFGMFQTLRPRDEVEGSGMGLAIVKKLVERQGGRIWLSDRLEGAGLVVHFIWPKDIRNNVNGTDRKSAVG